MQTKGKDNSLSGLMSLWPLVMEEKRSLYLALVAVLVNSGSTVLAPYIMALAIDTYIAQGNYSGVLMLSGVMLLVFIIGAVAAYQQVLQMGSVGQRVLYRLRERVFVHLQSLPVSFFQAHKSGDLISRINNDTQKLNQFFSETLVRLFGSLFVMAASALFMLVINWRLGLSALLPVLGIVVFTQVFTPWVRRANARSMTQLGELSAHIQESLEHFKVVVAFNRRDHFQSRFEAVNQSSFKAAKQAGIANQLFTPVYDFVFQLARLGVLAYGIYLVVQNALSVGLLIAYFTYLTRFYEPLRQVASLWTSFQTALASWERVEGILNTPNNLPVLPPGEVSAGAPLMRFEGVHFSYPKGESPVLQNVNFYLEAGKTYAFVGPTGGGKSTTAALMSRLYDPSSGVVRFKGRDLRSLDAKTRTDAIGFILQEPILFTASLRDNLVYGNPKLARCMEIDLEQALNKRGLAPLLSRFDEGLNTPITADQDNLSLGQKQLVAFMRAVLKEPELLILDEATANIDTLTEHMLTDILNQLPKSTTQVVIAHRLNTIENADHIFFVNQGEILPAGTLTEALEMLQSQSRVS